MENKEINENKSLKFDSDESMRKFVEQNGFNNMIIPDPAESLRKFMEQFN